MGRIVVMDEELHEAITVVEVPARLMREVEERKLGCVYMAVPPRVSVSFYERQSAEMECMRVVRLKMEPVRRGSAPRPIFWYAYANDPELALELRAAFLPGQLGEVQRREKEAFWRGAFAGLSAGR